MSDRQGICPIAVTKPVTRHLPGFAKGGSPPSQHQKEKEIIRIEGLGEKQEVWKNWRIFMQRGDCGVDFAFFWQKPTTTSKRDKHNLFTLHRIAPEPGHKRFHFVYRSSNEAKVEQGPES
jgi:hypothetical protein